MLNTHGAKELVVQVVTRPGTSHSGRSLTSIYRLAIKVSTAPYHGPILHIFVYFEKEREKEKVNY